MSVEIEEESLLAKLNHAHELAAANVAKASIKNEEEMVNQSFERAGLRKMCLLRTM